MDGEARAEFLKIKRKLEWRENEQMKYEGGLGEIKERKALKSTDANMFLTTGASSEQGNNRCLTQSLMVAP